MDELTVDEHGGIDAAIASLEAQTQQSSNPLRHYLIRPSVLRRDDETGIERGVKLSCVGFVIECYEDGAEIALLNRDEALFPAIDLDTLKTVYGQLGARLEREVLRNALGIPGPGPWRIHLPGYLLHSLARTDDEIRRTPYVPADADRASFPLPKVV